MKKILCIIVLVLSTVSAFAQLYVRGNIGYNLPANSERIGIDSKEHYNNETDEYEESYKSVYGSFGSGISVQLGLGGSINEVLGYDVEVGYLAGKKNSFSETYSDEDYMEKSTTEISSGSFQLAPSLTFTSGTGKLRPYTRIGPVIALTKLKNENTQIDTFDDIKQVYEFELTGGMSVGFKGVLGLTFNSDKKLQFFSEISFISMSYAPKEGEITAYTANGENVLSSIPKEQRKVKFKDKIDSDDEGNFDLRDKYSMGSIGIQAGIKYVLK